jgi:ribosome-associated translation inhibitor RaiA
VPADAVAYAADKVARVAQRCADPVLLAEVTLAVEPDPARQRPVVAEATLTVDGRPVRAHVAAGAPLEAVDLLEDRLSRRLRRFEQRFHREGRERHDTGTPTDGEWRHGDLPTHRPERFERPADERELVRRKTFATSPMTVAEAAFDLDMSGHDFYLFTELDTGADAVVHYRRDQNLGLQVPEGVVVEVPSDQVVTSTAPTLSVEDAIERLDAGNEDFVFFIRSDTGRGAVGYRRYDGHWGLITSE